MPTVHIWGSVHSGSDLACRQGWAFSPSVFFWTLFENTQYSQIAELVAEGIDVHPVDVLPHNFCCPLLSCFGEVVALHLLQDLQGAGKAQDPQKGAVTGSDLKSQPCRSASIWELRNYRWVKIDLHWSVGKVAATATGSKKGGAGLPISPIPIISNCNSNS